MKSQVRRWVTAVAAGLALAVAGMATGVLVAQDDDGAAPAARAEASARAVAARAERLERERDRLRAERNTLEARLAAERAPAVCPSEYVSTSDGALLPVFEVDYPCGWHALYDPRSATAEERPGLHAEAVLFSRLPISLAPRAGPIADVELTDWTDDPNDEGDALAPLEQWLDEERARFTEPPREDRFETGAELTIHRFDGSQTMAEEPTPVVTLLWEFIDPAGRRHVVRATTVAPSRRAREALDRLARSFAVLRP